MSNDSLPIVVGVNGSSEALRAARWAGAVATRLGAKLHILHAVPHPEPNAAASVAVAGSAATEEQRELTDLILKTAEAAVRSECPTLVVTTAAATGPADEAVAAASRAARLVVLGCDDVTVAGALLIGSTTLAILDRAACPIVAWRGDSTQPTDQAIVVGLDGSASDGGALGIAFEFADCLGAPLRVIHSWSHHHVAPSVITPIGREWDASAQAEWRHVNDGIHPWRERHPKVHVTLTCEPAKPNHAIVLQSADAQLVVVGSRRGQPLGRGLFGSTSFNLLHHSKVPVVLCPFDGHD